MKNALGYIRAVQSTYKLLALNLTSVIAENITDPVAKLLDKGEGARIWLLVRALPLLTTSTTAANQTLTSNKDCVSGGKKPKWLAEKEGYVHQLSSKPYVYDTQKVRWTPVSIFSALQLNSQMLLREEDGRATEQSEDEKQTTTNPPYLSIPAVCASKDHFVWVILQSLSTDCRVPDAGFREVPVL